MRLPARTAREKILGFPPKIRGEGTTYRQSPPGGIPDFCWVGSRKDMARTHRWSGSRLLGKVRKVRRQGPLFRSCGPQSTSRFSNHREGSKNTFTTQGLLPQESLREPQINPSVKTILPISSTLLKFYGSIESN